MPGIQRGPLGAAGSRLETELLRRAPAHNSCIQEGSVASSCRYNEHKDGSAKNISAPRGETGGGGAEGWGGFQSVGQVIILELTLTKCDLLIPRVVFQKNLFDFYSTDS